nr:serine/arginine repetitive matrix protein 1-like [Macaca fascicularis]
MTILLFSFSPAEGAGAPGGRQLRKSRARLPRIRPGREGAGVGRRNRDPAEPGSLRPTGLGFPARAGQGRVQGAAPGRRLRGKPQTPPGRSGPSGGVSSGAEHRAAAAGHKLGAGFSARKGPGPPPRLPPAPPGPRLRPAIPHDPTSRRPRRLLTYAPPSRKLPPPLPLRRSRWVLAPPAAARPRPRVLTPPFTLRCALPKRGSRTPSTRNAGLAGRVVGLSTELTRTPSSRRAHGSICCLTSARPPLPVLSALQTLFLGLRPLSPRCLPFKLGVKLSASLGSSGHPSAWVRPGAGPPAQAQGPRLPSSLHLDLLSCVSQHTSPCLYLCGQLPCDLLGSHPPLRIN